jgi:Tfp pilus assembly major pilin PilA
VRDRRAFTVVEILVVVTIGIILTSIAVPAFQNLLESSRRSLAVNALQNAVQSAQDIALSGREGEDGAIVFVYDAQSRSMRLVPAVKVGEVSEFLRGVPGQLGQVGFNTPYLTLDVFVPYSSGETIQLPENWMVRGYAPPGSMLDPFTPVQPLQAGDEFGRLVSIWYDTPLYGDNDVMDPIKKEANWVFPETGFYALDAQHVGGDPVSGDLGNPPTPQRTPRQSFMVRFDGQTGQLSLSTRAAIFVDPRPSRERPYGDQPNLDDRWKRVDLADSVNRWALRIIQATDLDGDNGAYRNADFALRELLIGNASHDTILVKGVSRLALYEESALARDLGARGVNATTGTIYDDYPQDDSTAPIEIDDALWQTYPGDDELRVLINRWIEGDTNGNPSGPGGDGIIRFSDDPELSDNPVSRLYLIQPYSGELQEIFR